MGKRYVKYLAKKNRVLTFLECPIVSKVFPNPHFGSFYPQNFVPDPQK